MTTLRGILMVALMARITLSDGTTRTAILQGMGCSASICSRVVIKGTAHGTPVTTRLDSIAAIRDTTADSVLLVLKDGTSRRLTLVNDFRVIYLDNRPGGEGKKEMKEEKLDLARTRSVEFVGDSHTK